MAGAARKSPDFIGLVHPSRKDSSRQGAKLAKEKPDELPLICLGGLCALA
jgi:hypothetical protein